MPDHSRIQQTRALARAQTEPQRRQTGATGQRCIATSSYVSALRGLCCYRSTPLILATFYHSWACCQVALHALTDHSRQVVSDPSIPGALPFGRASSFRHIPAEAVTSPTIASQSHHAAILALDGAVLHRASH
ncbi:hypothetical protein TgHK011_000756 [Trichoderma gracile]|nr:hypothetical protein TgHK011_000756 [Trichoderma gracile]